MSRKEIFGPSSMLCRICLQNGSVPIYGEDCASDWSFDVRTFGDIDVSEDDIYPKHLCDSCCKLLKCAILFRKTAKHSECVLKQPQVKSEQEDSSMESDVPEPDNIKSNLDSDVNTKTHTQTASILQQYYMNVVSDDESNKNYTCRTKSKIPKVQCKTCLKIITKAHFRDHYALHDPNLSKYICDICGKSFRQRSACINHRFIHSTDFNYKCDVCPYCSRTSEHLKLHMRIHTRDYRYMCTECPARFLTRSNFNRHTLKHKDPAFKCDTCKRGFHSKLILERHIQADHLGIKKHVCDLCGKAFGYRKRMMQHQINVHKRKKKSHGRVPAYLEAERKKQEQCLLNESQN